MVWLFHVWHDPFTYVWHDPFKFVTRRFCITHMNEASHAYECGMSRIWRRHVTHMNETCHPYEWGMSHVWMRHVTRMNDMMPLRVDHGLQYTAIHCNTLQHTATHCTTLHHTTPCRVIHSPSCKRVEGGAGGIGEATESKRMSLWGRTTQTHTDTHRHVYTHTHTHTHIYSQRYTFTLYGSNVNAP